jgi:hypothetical protein
MLALMTMRMAWAARLSALALVGAGVATGAPAAGAAVASARPPSAVAAPPSPLYAPYFETWAHNDLARLARVSGTHDVSLAFLQTPKPGSCTPTWNGNPARLVSAGGYRREIASLRRAGGTVIPSFGGASADNTGTELADSCPSVAKIARAYESVVRAYGANRLDFDIEGNSLDDRAGIARRDKAIAHLEAWAEQHNRLLRVDFTVPVAQSGLQSNVIAVLKNAAVEGAKVSVVNIMVFDWYDRTGKVDMARAAISAGNHVHRQLAALDPGVASGPLWAKEGLTLLPGVDDNPSRDEITTLADAQRILHFAGVHRLGLLSIWTMQRDNGQCPGAIDNNGCSGLRQPRWAFSHLLDHS